MVKTMTDSSTLSTHDPAFIVSAPTDYDMLRGEIERPRARVAQLEQSLGETGGGGQPA